ncbi:DNA repair protein XRCC3 [Centropristis striata]|uniref:DNA repair protein XRCC3 n=1 Tax=Centropristis striata TaxID=184440 RepID=UPI0027DF8ADA|nr:DNA repair protein XRCC3 [Centropristis striata]
MEQLDLHPRISSALRRSSTGHLRSVRDVLSLSGPDLQRLTGLSRSDVQQLLTAAATACRRRPPVPALLIHRGESPGFESGLRLSLGCPVLDRLLRGGLPAAGITELSGESAAGKTQLALQLCLSVQYPAQYHGLNSGAVFICTEDSFPVRRLQQLIRGQSVLRSDVPPALIHSLRFSDHVYVEHAADLDALQVCLSRRVPVLLARRLVRLLVVDSVAALFRSEFTASDWLLRNQQLISFSSRLKHLSTEFNIPVLCINQVTDVFSSDDSFGSPSPAVSPALGLAWANQVLVRLMMRRVGGVASRGAQSSALRRLEVVFAPHLAPGGRDAAVWTEGVQGLPPDSQSPQ